MLEIIETQSDSMRFALGFLSYEEKWKEGSFSGIVYAGRVAYLYMSGQEQEPELAIRSGTLGLSEFLFANRFCRVPDLQTRLRSVVLPASVVFIGEDVFEAFPDIELLGKKGSCAENHAAAHGNVRFREVIS